MTSQYTDEQRRKYVDEPVASVEWSSPPEDVATAARAYRREAGSPLTVVFNAVFALIFTGIIVGIPAFFLAVVADAVIPLELYAAGVAVVFAAVTVGFFIYFYRGSTKVRAVQLGLEAFLRGYAERRGMRSIDPAQFLALNPRLELPGTVQTALVGPLPGSVEGALATCIAGGKVGAAYWLVAALRVAPVEGVPYASLMPRVAEEDDGDVVVIGGFPVKGATGVVPPPNAPRDPAAAVDRRLLERFRITADDDAPASAVTGLFDGAFADWLLAGERGIFGLSLAGDDLTVLRLEPDVAKLTTAGLDGFVRDAEDARAHLGARP